MNTEQVVEKAVDKAANLVEAVYNLTVNAITEYGPVAWDTVLWVTRLEALSGLIPAFLTVIFLCYLWLKLIPSKYKFISENDLEPPLYIFGGIGSLAGLGFSCAQLLNFWNWVAVVKPELYLAHQVIEKVLK